MKWVRNKNSKKNFKFEFFFIKLGDEKIELTLGGHEDAVAKCWPTYVNGYCVYCC